MSWAGVALSPRLAAFAAAAKSNPAGPRWGLSGTPVLGGGSARLVLVQTLGSSSAMAGDAVSVAGHVGVDLDSALQRLSPTTALLVDVNVSTNLGV